MKLMSKDKIRGTKAVSFNMSIKYSNDNKTLGVQTFDNGDIYTGGFLEGKKHGHGVLKTRSERVYDGDWQDDVPHGYGVNTFPNGKTYKGEYKEGKPHGNGQWTYSDGTTYTGKWIKGEFINQENKKDTLEFRIVTFLINIIVIGFMLSVIIVFLLKLFKII